MTSEKKLPKLKLSGLRANSQKSLIERMIELEIEEKELDLKIKRNQSNQNVESERLKQKRENWKLVFTIFISLWILVVAATCAFMGDAPFGMGMLFISIKWIFSNLAEKKENRTVNGFDKVESCKQPRAFPPNLDGLCTVNRVEGEGNDKYYHYLIGEIYENTNTPGVEDRVRKVSNESEFTQ